MKETDYSSIVRLNMLFTSNARQSDNDDLVRRLFFNISQNRYYKHAPLPSPPAMMIHIHIHSQTQRKDMSYLTTLL